MKSGGCLPLEARSSDQTLTDAGSEGEFGPRQAGGAIGALVGTTAGAAVATGTAGSVDASGGAAFPVCVVHII